MRYSKLTAISLILFFSCAEKSAIVTSGIKFEAPILAEEIPNESNIGFNDKKSYSEFSYKFDRSDYVKFVNLGEGNILATNTKLGYSNLITFVEDEQSGNIDKSEKLMPISDFKKTEDPLFKIFKIEGKWQVFNIQEMKSVCEIAEAIDQSEVDTLSNIDTNAIVKLIKDDQELLISKDCSIKEGQIKKSDKGHFELSKNEVANIKKRVEDELGGDIKFKNISLIGKSAGYSFISVRHKRKLLLTSAERVKIFAYNDSTIKELDLKLSYKRERSADRFFDIVRGRVLLVRNSLNDGKILFYVNNGRSNANELFIKEYSLNEWKLENDYSLNSFLISDLKERDVRINDRQFVKSWFISSNRLKHRPSIVSGRFLSLGQENSIIIDLSTQQLLYNRTSVIRSERTMKSNSDQIVRLDSLTKTVFIDEGSALIVNDQSEEESIEPSDPIQSAFKFKDDSFITFSKNTISVFKLK